MFYGGMCQACTTTNPLKTQHTRLQGPRDAGHRQQHFNLHHTYSILDLTNPLLYMGAYSSTNAEEEIASID